MHMQAHTLDFHTDFSWTYVAASTTASCKARLPAYEHKSAQLNQFWRTDHNPCSNFNSSMDNCSNTLAIAGILAT